MDKLYKSLMRGSEGAEVTWRAEWVKAAAVQDDLFAIVEAIPTVRQIARQALQQELQQRRKNIDIDNVYINVTDKSYEIERRPSGKLSDVLFHCLDNNVLPNYLDGGGDGVFHLPETVGEQMRVKGFSIFEAEEAITYTLRNLESSLRSEMGKYWAAPVKVATTENTGLTNKQALHQAYNVVLTAELSLKAMAGFLDHGMAKRYCYLLNLENGAGAYNVVVSPEPDYRTSLGPGFVLDNAMRADPEMKLLNESTGYVLHTPGNGFEYFARNLDLPATLLARVSASGSKIAFPKARQSVSAYCVDVYLKGQLDTLASLMRDRKGQTQAFSRVLQDNQVLSKMRADIGRRFDQVQAELKRTEWPHWLKSGGNALQQRYVELEHSMEKYHSAYQMVFDRHFSFKEYVLRCFSDWAMSALGEHLDAETIKVRSVHKMQVGGRTLEQIDSRTLTEFIIFGLHDEGYKAEISITGLPSGSRLSSAALERWLSNINVRSQFVFRLPVDPSPEFAQAYRDHLHSNMEFALFVARHSGVFNETEAKVIERALAGDPSVSIRGLQLSLQIPGPTLKGVMIFQARETRNHLVYLKTPAGKSVFMTFADAFALNKWFESAMTADRQYAASLIHPDYLHDAGSLRGASRHSTHYLYKLDTRYPDLFPNGTAPLLNNVTVAYQSELALHKTIAPAPYRYLEIEPRKRYARLNTELKALSTVETRDNAFPSFERFTRDAVKQNLENLLRSRGRSVEIDPDQIIVQTDDFQKSVTDLLIEGLSFEAANPAYPSKNDPRYFLTGGHPAIDQLDIRDLSSLSKTFRPGDRYTEMLNTDYLDREHPDYAFKRAVHAKKVRCQMHYDLLSNYVDGRFGSEIFLALQRVVGSLKEDVYHYPIAGSSAEGDEGLYEFNIGKIDLTKAGDRTVAGVYILRMNILGQFNDWLYTPDAPDGVAYRPINDFIPSIRFRYGPMRDYYFDRVAIVDQKVINDYFDDLVATVNTRPPVKTQERAKLNNLFTFHDRRVRRALSDIDERTTSLKEVIAGLIYDGLIKATSVISLAVPPIGTLVVAVQMMKSVYDGSQAQQRGDYSAALGYGADALIGLFTLGQAATAGASAEVIKQVTNVQRSFLDLVDDARSAAQFVAEAAGHKAADQQLIDFITELMKDRVTGISQTIVR
ncbi:dermonecrotic toxin domain-containing protein [Pseudomonas sp. GM30]|uniref:dermonecrotic toxin domain-containing protein n=1 Tax=Pseudomonas sp. GM30 TaxID=1144328 RepID=UPI0002705705|nr:DUF6543 domain-containing protein [Pseudomonas sp. GM30]EUB83984.1 hypothetical protein PMI25_001917 [Pseudomonas sp. GM30]